MHPLLLLGPSAKPREEQEQWNPRSNATTAPLPSLRQVLVSDSTGHNPKTQTLTPTPTCHIITGHSNFRGQGLHYRRCRGG